jgi:multidrug efflux pump
LGIAVVGGLILSQLLTLYTTPVVFVLMDRGRLRLKRLFRKRSSGGVPQAPVPSSVEVSHAL